MKQVQKLLRDYTDGEQSKLANLDFTLQLVQDADKLNLIPTVGIRPTNLQFSLAAFLLRA